MPYFVRALVVVISYNDDIIHRKVVGSPFRPAIVPRSQHVSSESGWVEIVEMLTLKINERVGLWWFGFKLHIECYLHW